MSQDSTTRRRRGSYLPEQTHQERWGLMLPTVLAIAALAALAWFGFRLI